MENKSKDFEKFAKSLGVSASVFDDVKKSINDSLTPVILEERELNCQPLDIFSRMLYDRQIFFGHQFTPETCNIAVAQLLYLNSIGNNDINIMINSPGGSVVDGLSIIDTMNFINCDVTTTCVGMAASMGAVLLTSGTKGKRYVLPHSRVMIHQVSSGMQGDFSNLKIELQETERCRKDVYEILANTTNHTFEEIEQLCDRNNWLHGIEAVELGLADKVLTKNS